MSSREQRHQYPGRSGAGWRPPYHREEQQNHGRWHQVGGSHSGANRARHDGPRWERGRGRTDRPTADYHRPSYHTHTRGRSRERFSNRPHTRTQTRNTSESPIRQALDTQTRAAAKHHFKLLQAVHHLETVETALETGQFPPGMTRQVIRLTQFIKPSSPTETTQEKVKQNTEYWMETNMTILQQHYTQTITELTDIRGNQLAFRVATNWAKRRFGTRLDPDTITKTHNLLFSVVPTPASDISSSSSSQGEEKHSSSNPSNSPSNSPNCSLSQPVDALSLSNRLQVRDEERGVPSGDQEFPALPAGGRPQPESATHNKDRTKHVKEKSKSKHTPNPERQKVSLHDQNLNNKSKADWPRGAPSGEDGNPGPHPDREGGNYTNRRRRLSSSVPPCRVHGSSSPPRPSATSTPIIHSNGLSLPTSPIRQRFRGTSEEGIPGTRGRPGKEIPLLLTLQGKQNHNVQSSSIGDRLTSLAQPEQSGGSSNPVRSSRSKGVSDNIGGRKMMNNQGLRVKMTNPVRNSDPPTLSRDPTRTEVLPGGEESPAGAQSNIRELDPTYHPARNRKLEDWTFSSNKDILILGDSNINRIPRFNHPHVQADSYPGARFYHFTQIMDKTIVHPHTKMLILSVGINNRDQDPKNTSVKQLRALLKRARSAFPNAEIKIPIINFSSRLPQDQQNNLREINTFISGQAHLKPLPQDQFKTVADDIHWTPETAGRIFSSWCKQLNVDLNY